MNLGKYSKELSCVAAMDLKRGIGKDNNLPWKLRNEMKFFGKITTDVKNKDLKNAVVMGRRTWDSIPAKYKPLPDRINIVLSRTLRDVPEGVVLMPCLEDAMKAISKPQLSNQIERVFIVGGSGVYREAIESGCDRIYLTHIMKSFDCDTFFPEFDEALYKRTSDPDVPEGIQNENGIEYEFRVYEIANSA